MSTFFFITQSEYKRNTRQYFFLRYLVALFFIVDIPAKVLSSIMGSLVIFQLDFRAEDFPARRALNFVSSMNLGVHPQAFAWSETITALTANIRFLSSMRPNVDFGLTLHI